MRCFECGLAFLKEFPDRARRDLQYQEGYYNAETGGRFLQVFECAVSFFAGLRVRSILRRAQRAGAILDVGCGRGNLLELFQKKGWRAVGTQVSRTAAEAARKHRGVDVILGELPALHLPKHSFKVVTLFHVLEHLDCPREYLLSARDLLEDDGLLVIEVPDCSSPGFRLLGTRDFCFDYPHHLIFFTPSSLRRLLEGSGFEVEGVSRFSLEYSPYTTLQNLLNLFPGDANRLYRALMRNDEGRRLRRSPLTWAHAVGAVLLAFPALLLSLFGLVLPLGNTMRFYCRPRVPVGPLPRATT